MILVALMFKTVIVLYIRSPALMPPCLKFLIEGVDHLVLDAGEGGCVRWLTWKKLLTALFPIKN